MCFSDEIYDLYNTILMIKKKELTMTNYPLVYDFY